MNIDVAERLIRNLEASLDDEMLMIDHNQNIWLSDHTDVFVVSGHDRWSCATSGCAAGFIFLEEAPTGFVFDTTSERVFPSQKVHKDFIVQNPGFEVGYRIDSWAADILGINHDQTIFLFFQYGDTEETINRIRFLMENDNVSLYKATEVY